MNLLQNIKDFQQITENQGFSRKLNVPCTNPFEDINETINIWGLDAQIETFNTYPTYATPYHIPIYHNSFANIPHIETNLNNPNSSTKDNSLNSSIENTSSNDINKANQMYLEYLRSRTDEIANSISHTEFEDGVDNYITLMIKSFAKENKSATYNWLDELYSKNLNKPYIVQGILRSLAMITERGDENILLPIVVAGLRSNNSLEQEAAIMVIEEWRTKECLKAISSVTKFSSEMIANYAKMVINELKEELK